MATRQSWSKEEEEEEMELFFDAESDLPMEAEVFYDSESDLPLEAAEGSHPLELLTQDDWIHVLGHVDMPRDGWSMANVHPLFWTIFHSDLRDIWTSGMFLACIPHLLNHIPFEDVLGLRLVNRFSRSTVDHCLEQRGISKENVKIRVFIDRPNRIYVRGAQGNTRMPKLEPWKILNLVCSGVLQSRFMDAQFLSFFRRHGHQVEYLSVSRLLYQRVHPVEFLTFVRSLLIYLPNVKGITLDLYRLFDGNWERLAELETQFLEENPLPALPSLKRMYLENRSDTMTSALNAILQAYGGHLQELELQLGLPVTLPTTMSCLHTLHLQQESADMLSTIRASGAPLRSLVLEIENDSESEVQPMELFWALQPFRNTLDNLHVVSWTWEFGEIGELPNMEWPLLKTISLCNGKDCTPTNIGFLFSFPNLEELELGIEMPEWDDPSVGPEQRLEMLREHASQFEVEQNLWTRLGSLQFIKIVDFSERDEILVKRPSQL